MRTWFTHFLLYIACVPIFAQSTTYPEGGYATLQELLNRMPTAQYKVEVEQRSEGRIKMNGGNDYQLNPMDKSVKKSFLRNKLIAYSDGADLLINGYPYEIQTWYGKVEAENSQYFVFRAGLPSNFKRYGLEPSKMNSMFGGIIAGIGAAKRALIRVPYLLEKDTDAMHLISEENILSFIGDDATLAEQFVNEPEKGNVDTLMRYLTIWVQAKR